MSIGSVWARWANQIRRRARVLFRNSAVRSDIEEELRAHVEMEIEELRRQGMTEEQARRAALIAFGGIDRTLEGGHEAYGGRRIHEWVREHLLAVRSLTRRPLWSATAMLTLALGLGSLTALFTLVDGVLLSPLPFADAERLELVGMRRPGGMEGTPGPLSPLDLGDLRERSRAYTGLAAFSESQVTLRADHLEPMYASHTLASGDFFSILGQLPALGRVLGIADGDPGAPKVAVLSHDFWTRRFGADPAVLGSTIRLGDDEATVIGVTQRGLVVPRGTDVWSNYNYGFAIGSRRARWLQAIGRVAPGVSPQAAHEELDAIARQLASDHPASNEGWGVSTRSLVDATVGGVRSPLIFLFGATGLILLIALSNVGGLIVSQSEARQREFALRGALGAGRSDVLRQLLAEANILGAGASVLGFGLASGIVVVLGGLATPEIPRIDEVAVGWRSVGFMVLAVLPVVVALTVLPARRLLRGTAAMNLGHNMTGNRAARTPLKRGLVGVQVALSTVLLIGAALLARSFQQVLAEDPGFEPNGVLAVRVGLPAARYGSLEAVSGFYETFSELATAAPGIVSASVVSTLPLGDPNDPLLDYSVVERASGDDEEPPVARYRKIGPGFFETLGVEVTRGRGLLDSDAADAPGIAVINERLAQETFPTTDPVGQRLSITAGNFGDRSAILVREVEIVGVARDVRFSSPREAAEPTIYLSYRQAPFPGLYLAARLDVPTSSGLAALREALTSIDSELFVGEAVALDELYGTSITRERFLMLMLVAFSIVALILSAVGVFGIAASSVTRRSAEMAVRQALGADPRKVLAAIVWDLVVMIASGAVVGAASALSLSSTLDGLLYGISATDPLTFGAITGVVILVGLGAGLTAAWRILALDPAGTLVRAEGPVDLVTRAVRR